MKNPSFLSTLSEMDDLGIVILNYFSHSDCRELVEQFRRDNCTLPLIIIDNSVSTEEYSLLQLELSSFEKVIIIKNQSNTGFYKGNYKGLKYLRNEFNCRYALIVNPDVRSDNWNHICRSLRSEFNNVKSLFMCGPQIWIPGYKHKNSPTIPFYFLTEIICNLTFPLSYFIRKQISISKSKRSGFAFSIEGSCYAVSIDKFLKTKVWFNHIFLYSEEIIFGILSKKKGWKILYNSTIKVFHNHPPGKKNIIFDKNNFESQKEINRLFNNSSILRSCYILSLRYRNMLKKTLYALADR